MIMSYPAPSPGLLLHCVFLQVQWNLSKRHFMTCVVCNPTRLLTTSLSEILYDQAVEAGVLQFEDTYCIHY